MGTQTQDQDSQFGWDLAKLEQRIARAFAIDHRLPEPASFEDALTPPWVGHFGTHSDSLVSCMKSEDTRWATYSKACALMRQILGD